MDRSSGSARMVPVVLPLLYGEAPGAGGQKTDQEMESD